MAQVSNVFLELYKGDFAYIVYNAQKAIPHMVQQNRDTKKRIFFQKKY